MEILRKEEAWILSILYLYNIGMKYWRGTCSVRLRSYRVPWEVLMSGRDAKVLGL